MVTGADGDGDELVLAGDGRVSADDVLAAVKATRASVSSEAPARFEREPETSARL